MKKAESRSNGLRKEYKRSDFDKLKRGKYYNRVITGSNVVVIDPDVSAVFPNSSAVNEALHSLVDVAERATGITRGSTRRTKHRNSRK